MYHLTEYVEELPRDLQSEAVICLTTLRRTDSFISLQSLGLVTHHPVGKLASHQLVLLEAGTIVILGLVIDSTPLKVVTKLQGIVFDQVRQTTASLQMHRMAQLL